MGLSPNSHLQFYAQRLAVELPSTDPGEGAQRLAVQDAQPVVAPGQLFLKTNFQTSVQPLLEQVVGVGSHRDAVGDFAPAVEWGGLEQIGFYLGFPRGKRDPNLEASLGWRVVLGK